MPLCGLPPEIQDAIVDNIESRSDLLSLALTCTTFRDIVVPNHLHFRTIISPYPNTPLWNRLARRRDLARSVRRFGFMDGDELREFPQLWMTPPAAERVSVEDSTCDPTLGAEAFEGMINLRALHVSVPGRIYWQYDVPASLPAERRRAREAFPLFTACSHIASLQLEELHLSFQCPELLEVDLPGLDLEDEHSTPRPPALWRISNLTSLVLTGTLISDSLYQDFCSMVTLSPCLQVSLGSVDHPARRSLSSLRSLVVGRVFPPEAVVHILDFIKVHPGIEEFSWHRFRFNIPQSFFPLPSLKRLDVSCILSSTGVLEDKPPGSVDLEAVTISRDNRYAFPYLPAINPATLREVHFLGMDDPVVLRALSHQLHWRAVEILGISRSTKLPSASQRVARVFHGERVCSWMPFSPGELLPLLPRLRVVGRVLLSASAPLEAPHHVDAGQNSSTPRTEGSAVGPRSLSTA